MAFTTQRTELDLTDDEAQYPDDEQVDEEQYSEESTEDEAFELLSDFWAAETDPATLFSNLKDKEENYLQTLERMGFFDMCRAMFSVYFGLSNRAGSNGVDQWETQSIQFAGENGELIEFSVNEIRSFIDQLVDLIVKNRPAFQAEAQNTDFASMAQCEADDAMVTHYYEQEAGERSERELVKRNLLYGKVFRHIDWDPDGGPKVDDVEEVQGPEGPLKKPVKVPAGKFEVGTLYFWNVISEVQRSELDAHQWRLVVLHNKSKQEAMVRWPSYAKEISEVSDDDREWRQKFPGVDPQSPTNEDVCTYRIFYYARTAAMPEGRRCIFVGDVWVNPDDDQLPLEHIPVFPFMDCELHGTSFGVSNMWNLIPLQQMESQVLSDIATNTEAFGRPPLMLPEGSDIDLDALANGQRVIFVPEGVQQPTLLKTPEIPVINFRLLELLKAYKQSITALNAISRGDTAQGVTSGAHAALYESIAVEAQSAKVLELDLMREDSANSMLEILQKFAKHPQLVSIVGIDQRPYLKTFTPQNFAGIPRVRMKTANKATQTMSGRLQILDMLRQFPGAPLSDPQQIIEFISTGKMTPMFNTTRTIDLHVRWENEQLLQGPAVEQSPDGYSFVSEVPALPLENVLKHAVNHMEVLYSPEARENPAVMQAVMAHLEQHFFFGKNADPWVAQVLGNPAPMQLGVMPGQVDPSKTAPPGGKPEGGSPTPKQVGDAGQAVADPDATDDSSGGQVPKPAKPAGRPAVANQQPQPPQ